MIYGARFSRNPQVIFRKEEDGAYLYEPNSGKLKHLNRLGTLLYELCDGRHSAEEMIHQILTAYRQVSEDQAESDVDRFLAELLQMDLIKEVAN